MSVLSYLLSLLSVRPASLEGGCVSSILSAESVICETSKPGSEVEGQWLWTLPTARGSDKILMHLHGRRWFTLTVNLVCETSSGCRRDTNRGLKGAWFWALQRSQNSFGSVARGPLRDPSQGHEIGATITYGKMVYMSVTRDSELVPLIRYPIMRLFVT